MRQNGLPRGPPHARAAHARPRPPAAHAHRRIANIQIALRPRFGIMAEDPERLALSKPEILEFCDRVIKKWSEDPSKNAKNILAMNAVKASVAWTDEETLKAVWGEITGWMYELLYENAMAQARKDGSRWAGTLGDLKGAR